MSTTSSLSCRPRSRDAHDGAKTLRVIHLCKWAPPVRGGIETIVRELASAMADRSDIDLECWCYADRTGTRATAPNVVVRRFRTNLVIASAPISVSMLLRWLGARRRLDVVHLHVPNPWIALMVLLMPTHAVMVVSVHAASTRHRLLRRPHDALMDRLLRQADAIVVSAGSNAAHFSLDRYASKVHVIPFGIDPSRLGLPSAGGLGAVEDAPGSRKVLFTGRLVPGLSQW